MAKSKLLDQISQLDARDGHRFWQLVNQLRQNKRTGNPIDPEIWAKYFTSLNKESQATKDDSKKIENLIEGYLKSNPRN